MHDKMVAISLFIKIFPDTIATCHYKEYKANFSLTPAQKMVSIEHETLRPQVMSIVDHQSIALCTF